MSRAQRLLSRMPAIVNTYRELIEGAMKALTDPCAVFAAREAIRRLLVENNILLEPNADHRAAITVAENRFFDRAGTGVDHCGARDR
jgi:hypothetical protein